MPCYHPMVGVEVGKNEKTGKPKIKVSSAKDFVWEDLDKENIARELVGLKPIMRIPCGKCIGCRLEYSRKWAIRTMQEVETAKCVVGVTLTYDDENLPILERVNPETGEIVSRAASLKEEDVTKFLKRLRQVYARGGHKVEGKYIEVEKSDNIRLIYAGEYGDQNERPHYHLIMFNMEVPDQVLLHNSKKGNPLFWSKLIEDIWGKGMVVLNEVTWEYAAYVARYIMKKQKGLNSAEYYLAKGYEPEYFRMSRRPGIGKDWYELHKDEIYKNDEMFVKTKKGALKIRPNSYYDRLYDADNPELMAEIKERRAKHAENAQRLVLQNTTLNEQEYREVQERTKLEKIKSLTRDLV